MIFLGTSLLLLLVLKDGLCQVVCFDNGPCKGNKIYSPHLPKIIDGTEHRTKTRSKVLFAF